MKRSMRRLMDFVPGHRPGRDLPAGVRRRMYNHLVRLIEEEKRVQEMLKLPVRPRLSVVDEARVAILRPSHREDLLLDDQFVAAEKDMYESGEQDEYQHADDIGPEQEAEVKSDEENEVQEDDPRPRS